MLTIRRNPDIHTEEGEWFTGRWHFSFDGYSDPEWNGLGPLRVFNDDRLIAGGAWPMHEHRDIEAITYVLEGTFEHADSLGNGGHLKPGAVQRMTLGSGAEHSERNASPVEPMRFVQIWLLPNQADLPPSIEQRQYHESDRLDQLLEVASPHGGSEAVTVQADGRVLVGRLHHGNTVEHGIAEGRAAYIYLLEGSALFDDEPVTTGDAAIVRDQPAVLISAQETSELVVVDVPVDYKPVGVWA